MAAALRNAYVFLASGLGIGSCAAAIPRVKAELALSDAGLSVALLAFAAGAIVAMPLMGLFGHRLRSGPAALIAGFAFAGALALRPIAGDIVRGDVPCRDDEWADGTSP